ncbi:MAG TPA: class I SAM-dependent rRNA methyltransferase [Patescibacteria group bacterium]|nr:class I SAM-dependent rRNA methyltransferase [Patescibacteria group bacterium]
MYPVIKLKPGKDVPIKAGHPWIFSEAIAQDHHGQSGDLVRIESAQAEPLGIGTWNGKTSIRVRILSRDPNELIDELFFSKKFRQLAAWKESRLPPETNGYRLVHAEADGLPGLIVDRYDETFVFQLHTAGMDRFRNTIVSALTSAFHPAAIVERSDLDVRRLEGLADQPTGIVHGSFVGPIPFKEAGITFLADVLNGQKTGFFLDQRNARLAAGRYAHNKRVLNLFGYTGAFSVHAIKGGASFVTTADVSHAALELAQKNFEINGFDPENESRCQFLEADVMELMQETSLPEGPYDLIICDPPAFAKSERHLKQAVKAYTDLNAACLKQLDPGGILVTSSCSGRLEPEAFRSLLRIAAGRANRNARLLEWIIQPVDHAERLAFPEGRYLKTAILEVTE